MRRTFMRYLKKKRIIALLLLIITVIQFNAQTIYAVSPNNVNNIAYERRQENKKEKERPKGQEIKEQKEIKIPNGLKNKPENLDKWLNKKEIINNREQNIKVYDNEDGTNTAVVYLSPIHVQEENGQYINIDNELMEIDGEFDYTNREGIYDVYFNNSAETHSLMEIEKDNVSIQISSEDINILESSTEGNQIIYADVIDGIEHLFTVNNTGVKEDIILWYAPEKYSFNYEIDVKGPADVELIDSVLKITSQKTKEIIYEISAPYMSDNEGNMNYNIAMSVEEKKGKYILTIETDKEWLNDLHRVYPVIIDPNVSINHGSIEDTYVESNFTYNQHTNERLYVGYDNGDLSGHVDYAKGQTRSLIYFNLPQDIKEETIIESAKLYLDKYTTRNYGGERNLEIHRASESFSITNVIWNNQPSTIATGISTLITPQTGQYSWDITSVIDYWINAGENYGLILKMQNEDGAQGDFAAVFRSTEAREGIPPKVEITYVVDEPEEPPVEPPIEPETGDFELILQRDDINDIGVAYAKHSLTRDYDENKVAITYNLLPDNLEGSIEEENITTLDWETDQYELELNKRYQIEAEIVIEELIPPEEPDEPDEGEEGEGNTEEPEEEPEPVYEEAERIELITSPFLVYEVQPYDTLRRIAKHYLGDGNKYTEILELNQLENETLFAGQKLFIITDVEDVYNYSQPTVISEEIKEKDELSTIYPQNTPLIEGSIHPKTGDFVYGETDAFLTTYNMPIAFTRSYTSGTDKRLGPFGSNWDFSYNKYLTFYQDGMIGYNKGDGSRIYFQPQESSYTTQAKTYDELNKTDDGYIIKTNNHITYKFNNKGLLSEIIDFDENSTQFTYNNHDWLITITDALGREIQFNYHENNGWSGFISGIILPDTTEIQYDYQLNSNLLSVVTDGEKNPSTYLYNDKNLLNKISEGRGNTLFENIYDSDGKVISQKDGKRYTTNISYQSNGTLVTDKRGYDYNFVFNNDNWVTEINYPDDTNESYQYNSMGELTDYRDTLRQQHSYSYNLDGYITSYTRHDNKTETFQYNSDNLLTQYKDFEDNVTTLIYDDNKHTSQIIKGSNITEVKYSKEGLLDWQRDADNVLFDIDISNYPYEVKIKDVNRVKETYVYDDLGRVIASTDAKGNTTRITYDNNGNILHIKYPSTSEVVRTVTYTYDANNNLETETSSRRLANGQHPYYQFSYDNNNQAIYKRDAYGNTIGYEYDENGNLIREEYPNSTFITYLYDKVNQLDRVNYSDGSEIEYHYDDLGNVTSIEDQENNIVTYQYDYSVNQIKQINYPDTNPIKYYYDEVGNLDIFQSIDGTTIDYDYDDNYNVTFIEDETDQVTRMVYTPAGRIDTVYYASGKVESYSYNEDGTLKEIVEKVESGVALEMKVPVQAYYSLDQYPYTLEVETSERFLRTSSMTSKAIYKTSFTYDENGNIKTITDPEGNVTTYTYNEINQVETKTDANNETITYSYDEDGNLSVIENQAGDLQYIQYDARGLVEEVEIPEANTNYSYTYNSLGLVETYTDPLGHSTTYHYDGLGRLEEEINGNDEAVTYNYYKDGLLKEITYPNGDTEYYEYDTNNRIETFKDRADVTRISNYNIKGQVTKVTDTVGNEVNYQYDSYGRVKEMEDVIGRTKTFTYNIVGDLTDIKDYDGNVTKYAYDSFSRLTKVTDPENNVTTMSYDGLGRVESATQYGNRTYSYAYDAVGNIVAEINPLGEMINYEYDEKNNLSKITDGRGNTKTYTYDTLNTLKTYTDGRGNTTTYSYYAGGFLESVKDPKGNITNYSYDGIGRVDSISNPLGETILYEYDYFGNATEITDGRGQTSTLTYTPRNQLKKVIDTAGNEVLYQYYANGNLKSLTDQENNTSYYEYDELHRLTKKTEANGYIQNFSYDIRGDLVKTYDNSGKQTLYTYDKIHRILTEVDDLGLVTSYIYNQYGNLETITDPIGNTTNYDYDAMDRVVQITDPEENITKIGYDQVGNVKYITDPNNVNYVYQYDGNNNVTTITDGQGESYQYSYDANNNLETMTNPLGHTTTYEYDPLNRLEGQINETGGKTQYSYDPLGNISKMIDGNGNLTKYTYNNQNLIQSVTDGEGNTTRYTYYDNSNLKTMTDARNNTTNYTYNEIGQVTSIINPLGQVEEIEYNVLGDVEKIIKPDGNEIDYVYNDFNQLEKVIYPDGEETTFTYDSLGRQINYENEKGSVDLSYDNQSNITYVSNPVGEEIQYAYDDQGKLIELIYPDGKTVSYEYDNKDHLIKVIDREDRETTYSYDEQGKAISKSVPNGITTSYAYDEAGRIDTIENKKDTGENVDKRTYTYDSAGNLVGEEIWQEDNYYKREYSYNKNNAVIGMEEIGDNLATYKYEYDGAGNIIKKTIIEDGETEVITYQYDSANRVIGEYQGEERIRSYRYDENGNMVHIIRSEEIEVAQGEVVEEEITEGEVVEQEVIDYYYYDYNNQLEEVVMHNGHVFTYGYDGMGERLYRTYSRYSIIKPPIEEDERIDENNREELKEEDQEKPNKEEKESKENGNSGNTPAVEKSNKKDLKEANPDKDNGNSSSNSSKNNDKGNSSSSKESSNGNGNKDNEKGNSQDKETGNDKDNGNSDKENKGYDKNEKEEGLGWAKGKNKEKKENQGKHLGWYKNGKADELNPEDPENPEIPYPGYDLNNPEIFEVTNYINDITKEYTEVLMTTDIDGNYRGAYTYGRDDEIIGVEDLGKIEGQPNDPLYYLYDVIGSTVAITNMNANIIDSNRFGPYGEPIDKVGKNARQTNSPYGFTGEAHDIEGDLVYLRARYYNPSIMRFIQQDSHEYLGNIKEPLSRNRYAYVKGNPLKYTDPSGHKEVTEGNIPTLYYFTLYSQTSVYQQGGKVLRTYSSVQQMKENELGANLIYKMPEGLEYGLSGSGYQEVIEEQIDISNIQVKEETGYEVFWDTAQSWEEYWWQEDDKLNQAINAFNQEISANGNIDMSITYGTKQRVIRQLMLALDKEYWNNDSLSRYENIKTIYDIETGYLEDNLITQEGFNAIVQYYNENAKGFNIKSHNAFARGKFDETINSASYMALGYYYLSQPTQNNRTVITNKGTSEAGKSMTWNEFQSANKGKYTQAEMSQAWAQYKQANGITSGTTTSNSMHGNSLSNPNTNYGYQLVDKTTGEVVKYGETLYPNIRYTKTYLESINARMEVLTEGTKYDIHMWQHYQIEEYFEEFMKVPRLNKGFW